MAKMDKQQQIQELLKKAEDGTRAVFESENYRNYLVTMSKFHNYSFRNNILIYMQEPEATRVAGYVAWQKNFNRHVQRGEKGIVITGYSAKNIEQQQEKKDENGNYVLGTDGKPETETVAVKIPAFFPVYVYDVSQTEGEPLPRLANELDGSVKAYQDLMAALHDVSPFPIVFEDIQGGAYGYASPLEQKIAVRQGLSEAQTVKTTIHEITHADLHAPEINLSLTEHTDRQTKEVEAESVAFIVCNHYGIDSSDYSFGYLAAWSSNKELKELQNSLDTIQKQASDLITRIDTRLEVLGKEHTIVSENKIEEAHIFSIYQMKSGEETKAFRFEGIDYLEKHNIKLSLSLYDNVYEGTLPTNATLDNIYEEFNMNPPADFKGHSLSVSDVFVVEHNGIPTAHYIDRIGFEYVATLSEEIAAERQGEVPKITDHYADSILHDNDIDADREKTREQLGFKDTTSQQPQEKISVKERFNAAKEESARRNTEYKANNGKPQMDKEEL